MDTNEVEKFLTETDEGKALIEGFKEPLLAKRDELFTQMKSLKDELETFKTAEQVKTEELETVKRQEKEQQLKANNDFEAYKQFHEQEVEKYKSEIGSFQTKFARKEADRVIAETAMKYSRSPKPLQLLLKERVKSELDENGNVCINVYDDNGKQMYFEGQPASVEHLVESLKTNEDYAPFFASNGVSGSGSQRSEPMTTSYNDMNSSEFNLSKAMGNKV